MITIKDYLSITSIGILRNVNIFEDNKLVYRGQNELIPEEFLNKKLSKAYVNSYQDFGDYIYMELLLYI